MGARRDKRGGRRWWMLFVAAVVSIAALAEWKHPLARVAKRVTRSVWDSAAVTRVESHTRLLRSVAHEVKLDPNLLAGLVFVESRGKVGALSGADALGLFQLRLPTAIERAAILGLDEPTRDELLRDADLNARLGASHFAWLVRRYRGDIEAALVAYNLGPGKLDRWIKDFGSYARWRDAAEVSGRSEVLNYARTVLAWRERFAERGSIQPDVGPPAPRAAKSVELALVGPPPPDHDAALDLPPPID